MNTGNRLFFVSIIFVALTWWQTANASILFQDDFSDAYIDPAKWVFSGNYSNKWIEDDLKLNNTGGQSSLPVFGYFKGVTTPSSFALQADVAVLSNNLGYNNSGYVGFFWGQKVITGTVNWNMAYLDLAGDRVHAWSTNGQGTYHVDSSLVNAHYYHLSVTVDEEQQFVKIGLGNTEQIFTGDAYTSINKNVGGAIGLYSWGDNVCWDNVKLSTLEAPAVPVPSSFLLFSAVLVGLAGINRARMRR